MPTCVPIYLQGCIVLIDHCFYLLHYRFYWGIFGCIKMCCTEREKGTIKKNNKKEEKRTIIMNSYLCKEEDLNKKVAVKWSFTHF